MPKSFTDVNRAAGTDGFRPDEHPASVANNDTRGKGAPKQSGSGLVNPYGDNDGAGVSTRRKSAPNPKLAVTGRKGRR